MHVSSNQASFRQPSGCLNIFFVVKAVVLITQQKRKCVFHTKSMLPVTCLHPEMSLGAYFRYEIYTSIFAVYIDTTVHLYCTYVHINYVSRIQVNACFDECIAFL